MTIEMTRRQFTGGGLALLTAAVMGVPRLAHSSSPVISPLPAYEPKAFPPLALLVTLKHPDLVAPIRLTNGPDCLVSQGRTFLKVPLQTKTQYNPCGLPRLQLTMGGLPPSMLGGTSLAGLSPTVLLEMVSLNEPDTKLFAVHPMRVAGTVFYHDSIALQLTGQSLGSWRAS